MVGTLVCPQDASRCRPLRPTRAGSLPGSTPKANTPPPTWPACSGSPGRPDERSGQGRRHARSPSHPGRPAPGSRSSPCSPNTPTSWSTTRRGRANCPRRRSAHAPGPRAAIGARRATAGTGCARRSPLSLPADSPVAPRVARVDSTRTGSRTWLPVLLGAGGLVRASRLAAGGARHGLLLDRAEIPLARTADRLGGRVHAPHDKRGLAVPGAVLLAIPSFEQHLMAGIRQQPAQQHRGSPDPNPPLGILLRPTPP